MTGVTGSVPEVSLRAPASSGSRHPSRGEAHPLPYAIFFATYLALSLYFFLAFAEPYLAAFDLYAPRMLADSIAYQTICITGQYYLDWLTFRDIGPCLALAITSFDMGLLSLLNAALIVASVLWLARGFNRPWRPLLALILVNPITFLSIFGPNKEVFGIVTIITLCILLNSRSPWAFLVCMVAALFTRIPMLITVLLFCIGVMAALPYRKVLSTSERRRYGLVLAVVIILSSIVVFIAGAELQFSLLGDVSGAEMISQGTQLSLSLEPLSQSGLYFVAYLGRLVLNLYSGVGGITTLGRGGVGIYYGIGVAGSSLAFALATFALIVKRRPRDLSGNDLSWNLILFLVVFTLSICISPVVQHRYFYPLYVILMLFLTQPHAEGAPREMRNRVGARPGY